MPEENIENIAKWDSYFPPSLADHHLLSDINFNGHWKKFLSPKK